MRELQDSSPSFTQQFHFQTQCQFGPSPPKLLVALDAVFMIFYTKSKFYLLVKFQNFHNTHKPEFLHTGQQSHPNLLLQDQDKQSDFITIVLIPDIHLPFSGLPYAFISTQHH